MSYYKSQVVLYLDFYFFNVIIKLEKEVYALTILIFILLTIFVFKLNKIINVKEFKFLVSLKFIDGFIYFVYMLTSFICFIFLFQDISLPIFSEHPIYFKILLGITAFKLISLVNIIPSIKNPENSFRQEILKNYEKQKQIKEELKKQQEKIEEIKKEQEKEFIEFQKEISKLKESDLSVEEFSKKANEIKQKYYKKLEERKEQN